MQTIDRDSLLALDNLAIIYRAAAAGMKVYPEDQFVNYAEIDLELEDREDQMVQKVKDQIKEAAAAWLKKINDPGDLDPDDLDLKTILKKEILDHIESVWKYGQGEADKELKKMNVASNGEVQVFASGSQSDMDGTWNDAYDWYDQYADRLAASGQSALFIRMQPLILEAIDQGIVRSALADMLAADFARYGAVRADIIARTESSKAFNWGRRYRFDQSPSLGGYRYSAIMDERTTPICKGLHGSSWEKGDPALNGYTPPNHYRCRSILVPISKYKDWTWQDPDLSQLSDKDREMLEKFKDSSFYPLPSSIRAAATPTGSGAAGSAAAATPEEDDPAPAPDYSGDVQEYVEQSRDYSAAYITDLVDSNIKRGVNSDHPTLNAWRDLADELKSDKYDGKMVLAEYNAKAKDSMKITVFEPYGQIFIGEKGKISKKDREMMMAEIDKVKDDPLFKGVKIQLENKSKSRVAYYNANKDLMGVTKAGRGTDTLYHEIGHRVHNQSNLYDSKFESILRNNEINITPDMWDKWKKTADPYWQSSRTYVGSDLLPDDVFGRFDYPINAKQYYKKGTKANFHKEMFAETTSVYLEGDKEWIKKVKRTYPGLLEYMEEVYNRGVIK